MAFFGFDPLTLPQALTLVALSVCPVESAPRVDVHFAAEKPMISEKHGSAVLRRSMAGDRESTLTTDDRTTTFGVTSSITTDNVRVHFKSLRDNAGNECVYVDRVIFWISYHPAIFISSDILDMPCSLEVTRAHENQHVAIDIAAIQEYLPRVRMDMLMYLQSLGYQGFGPLSARDAEKKRDEIGRAILAAAKPMVEKLREARRQRQGEIDTPENYRLEAEKCPQDQPIIWEKFYKNRKTGK